MTIDIHALSPELRLGVDGIWYGTAASGISYPSDGNDSCFAVEEGSFWFKHRNECIIAAVKRLPPNPDEPLFDIGGGNGFVSKGLANAGFEVVLLEPGLSGAANAKKRGLPHVICATTDTAKIRQGTLAAVGLFDVVEHMEDDVAFLKSIKTLMKPGGRMYATVPSYSCLWSAQDCAAGHFRRYRAAGICNVLEAAGFKVEFSSYIFRVLPIPIFLLRVLPFRLGWSTAGSASKRHSRTHAGGGRPANKLVSWLLRGEVDNLRLGQPMRFGGSCLVVATAG